MQPNRREGGLDRLRRLQSSQCAEGALFARLAELEPPWERSPHRRADGFPEPADFGPGVQLPAILMLRRLLDRLRTALGAAEALREFKAGGSRGFTALYEEIVDWASSELGLAVSRPGSS